MDRSVRALSLAEDALAAAENLRAKINAESLNAVSDGAYSSFGTVASSGGAVVAAFDGSGAALTFCGQTLASGASPLMASIPAGRGELALSAVRNNARALVIGAKKIAT